MPEQSFRTAAARTAAALMSVAALAGCASADKNQTTTSSGGSVTTASSASSGMSGMSGMSGSSAGTGAPQVGGIKAVASQLLASAQWQGMKIQARTMTAAPFLIYNGTGWTEIKPTAKTSFHLMVMLDDARTGVAIPYSNVWATISKGGRIAYDERLWPMISEYMGPHYGNNVSLPGAGHYQLKLVVSPPIVARHLEYKNVWLEPHTVTVGFNWKPTS